MPDTVAIIGAVVLVLIIGVLFLLPSDQTKKYKYKRSAQGESSKDWQAVSLRLEKHISSLRKENAAALKEKRDLERQLMVQKEKFKKFQDKLSQERGWKDRERHELEKRVDEIKRLENDFKASEQELEKEHRERLRLEREIKEAQRTSESYGKKIKALDMEILKMKAQSDHYRKEITELKGVNQKLSKKHEDTMWIAKSEYVKLQNELKAAQSEFKKTEREYILFKEKIDREML